MGDWICSCSELWYSSVNAVSNKAYTALDLTILLQLQKCILPVMTKKKSTLLNGNVNQAVIYAYEMKTSSINGIHNIMNNPLLFPKILIHILLQQ
jgi:hypothetical protein